jgi:hypothetical protein
MGINPQIGSAVVRFEGDHFQVDPTGYPVFTFPIHEHGEVLDFAAWHPKSGRLAVLYGAGFAINQEAIFNPASHFCGQPLRIHRTPLEYLKADRHGIVIINSSLTYVSLRGSGPLSVADNALGHQIRRWWKPPKVASCTRWEPEPVSMTANDALAADAAGDSNRSAIDEAVEFLRDLLGEGSVPTREVKAEASSAGLTWATVRRAKDRIGITPRREGFGDDGVWVWELPKVLNFLKDAHV